ncbi:unnamed protein product [Phyllotreta striolata]|uniref:Deltamethrin resistance protein prag01 domain-containing protein n=1 Tax=Phyllotreta striolata TaxID=444603 RepID=A0A9N9TPQ0_PHYSR|nr:unnamed protein product [Phyllotreta striolata]
MLNEIHKTATIFRRQVIKKSILPRFASKDCGPPWTGTYNDLPQPEGDWKIINDRIQKKGMKVLILGISSLVITILFGKASGMLDGHHEFPDRPAPSNNYKCAP